MQKWERLKEAPPNSLTHRMTGDYRKMSQAKGHKHDHNQPTCNHPKGSGAGPSDLKKSSWKAEAPANPQAAFISHCEKESLNVWSSTFKDNGIPMFPYLPDNKND
jgi:hypothetical protein